MYVSSVLAVHGCRVKIKNAYQVLRIVKTIPRGFIISLDLSFSASFLHISFVYVIIGVPFR